MNRAALITLVAGLTVASAATVSAQTDDEEPVPERSGTIELELVDQSFELRPNGTISLSYRIVGDLATAADLTPPTTTTTTTTTSTTTTTTTTLPVDPNAPVTEPVVTPAPETTTTTTEPPPPPPTPIVARVLNYEPLTDIDDIDDVVGPSPQAFALGEVIDGIDFDDVRPSIEVAEDGTARLELAVPTDRGISEPFNLEFVESGIHPIVVQLRLDDQVIATHGTVVDFSTNGNRPPPVTLSWLAGVSDPGLDATPADTAAAEAQFQAIVQTAGLVEAPFTLAIPPDIATNVNVDEALADQLLTEELLATAAPPFDVSSAAGIDRVDAFIDALLTGEDQLRSALPRVPVRREVWLTTEPLSAEGAAALRDLGVQYLAMSRELYATSIAADPDEAVPSFDTFVELNLPDGSTMPVILIDTELGAAFTTEATDDILATSSATDWAIETIAQLRLEQLTASFTEQREQRSHLVATPDLSAPDPRLLLELERVAANSEVIEFIPASLLTSVTGTQATPEGASLPAEAGPSLASRVARIEQASISLASAGSMLEDDDGRPAVWNTLLDELVSTSFSEDDANEVIDSLLAQGDELRGAVVAPEPFTFTLTGREGDIQIRIRNRFDEPVRVLLRLSSARFDFPTFDDDEQIVTLRANDVTVVDVPAEARSNGTSPITVEIFTPRCAEDPDTECEALTEPVTLTARVTALTGLGQVLTGALVLILLTWWISNWRARRRKQSEMSHPSTWKSSAE